MRTVPADGRAERIPQDHPNDGKAIHDGGR
ncbi:hypothetical protein HD841_002967 [Sphingomonas melonis]|uniref:Uncharacterized protein n=1 Tax=Sphingomonas melonis TaxID=152682 RepID=A0A7Y9K4A3_9SPHN|nr:hypothetical protein [Sphingomonas melonis]